MDSLTIGQRIRDLRLAKGLSAYRVSKDSGVPQSLLSVIESGKGKNPPTEETLGKLAPVLGVSFEDLKAWADADRIGADSVERISREWVRQHLAELATRHADLKARIQAAETEEELLALQPELDQINQEVKELEEIDRQQNESEPPSPTMEKPSLKALDAFGGSQCPPTDEELSFIKEAEELGVWFGAFTEPGFWDDPPEERRRTFRYLDGLLEEARRIQRKKGTK